MSTRGDLNQARNFCLWAVDHVTRTCGTNDAEVAWIDDMMGHAYVLAGRHADALPVYKHMLEIRTAALPAQHPDLADAHNRLASVLFELGRRDAAVEHLEQALAIRTRAFGAEHPLSKRSADNLQQARADDPEP